MKFVIESRQESISALFTRLATAGSLENLLKFVQESGAAMILVEDGSPVAKFESPDEFIAYVNKILASHVKCDKCGYEFQCAPGWISASNTIGCLKCGNVIQLK